MSGTWLAQQGWRVTAVDVSATPLMRASTHATTAGVADRIDFQQHDLTRTFPTGAFDLVSSQYLRSPVEFPRDRVLHEAARTGAHGGLLVIHDHASVAPWSWTQDPNTCTLPRRRRWPRSTCVPGSGTPSCWALPNVRRLAQAGSPPRLQTMSSRSDAARSDYPDEYLN